MVIPCLQQRCMHISTRFANRVVSRNIRNSSDLIKKRRKKTHARIKFVQDSKKNSKHAPWKFVDENSTREKRYFFVLFRPGVFFREFFFEKYLLFDEEIIGKRIETIDQTMINSFLSLKEKCKTSDCTSLSFNPIKKKFYYILETNYGETSVERNDIRTADVRKTRSRRGFFFFFMQT